MSSHPLFLMAYAYKSCDNQGKQAGHIWNVSEEKNEIGMKIRG